MQIILEELLKLHPLNKGRVLAGQNGLKRPIDLFGILETPDSFHFVRNNEFLMSTGYMFKDNPVLQYKIVKELYSRGVCALGIKVGRYINEVSEDVLDFCNEHNFPLLYLPNGYGWYDFFSPLLILMHVEPESNKDLLNKMTNLSDKILDSNNFNEITKYIYGIFKKPCCIHIKYNETSIIYPEQSSLKHISIETLVESFNNEDICPIINDIKRIKFEDKYILISSIKHDKNCYGYIYLLEGNNSFTIKDIYLFQYFIVCLQFYTNSFLDLNRKFTSKQNEFLLRIVNEENIDNKSLLYESNGLNIDLYSDYIISVSKELPISNYEDTDTIYKFIEKNINLKYKVLSAFDFDGNYIVFNPIDKNISLPKAYKDTKLKIIKIKKELEDFFNGNFSFGIGNFSNSIQDIRKSYLEAVRAFDCYNKFFNNGFIISFKDLGIYSILSNPNIKEDIENFSFSCLNPLIKFDKENKGQLITTLEYFFEFKRSFRSCGKEMNLHHNTIRYRIKKIEELCDMDLCLENDLLELEVALKLLPFVGNK